MKNNLYSFSAVSFLLLLFYSGPAITTEQVNNSSFAKNHFIVKLKENKIVMAGGTVNSLTGDLKLIRSIADNLRVQTTNIKKIFPPDIRHQERYQEFQLGSYYTVSIDRYSDIPTLCDAFERNPNVDFAEPDFIGEAAGERTYINKLSGKPNDEFFERQWGLSNDGTVPTTRGKTGKPGADINAIKGWDIETGSEDVIVAILDSGVKLDHPDLSGRIWINPKEAENDIDDDGNGYIDDIYGWNFAYENSNVTDDGGHGTNIAGTIGANTNNLMGFAGVDQKCKLMICKNLDNDNLGEYSWWSASLYYAANNGARVINMSEGGYDFSKTLQTAVNYAYNSGCVISASMMNKNNGDNYYPASYKNVIAVGATDTDDGRCRQFTWGGGSNWGKHISVVAPGNRIYGLDYRNNNNFDVYWSGTSQATAFTSGLASLLFAQNKNRTNAEIKEIITSTAKDQVGDPREDKPGWDEYYGFGRIDIYEALNYDKSPAEKIDGKIEDKDTNNAGDRQAKAADKESKEKKSESKKAHRADR